MSDQPRMTNPPGDDADESWNEILAMEQEFRTESQDRLRTQVDLLEAYATPTWQWPSRPQTLAQRLYPSKK